MRILRRMIRALLSERADLDALWAIPGIDAKTPIDEIVDQVTPLKDHSIRRILGQGYESVAFELDNGNVLKVMFNDAGTSKKYEQMRDRSYSGAGSINDIHIYDMGKVYVPSIRRTYAWVEMQRVMTIEDWAKREKKTWPGPVLATWQFVFYDHKGTPSVNSLVDSALRDHPECRRDLPEVKAMAKGALRASMGEEAPDLHDGNGGVIEMRGRPPVFVFFDTIPP